LARRLLALLIVGAAGSAHAQLSPGPLAAAHAKLDDDRSCGSCHSSGKQVDDQKCLACHKPLAVRIQASKGLHASYAGKPCSSCHVEHLGTGAHLVRWPGGAAAKLDHAQTGWPLRGAHAAQPCAKCHQERSFLAVKETCNGCHADPHKGRFGGTCASCHDEVKFTNVQLGAFDHARTAFPLLGKHETVACKACHGEPARWTGLSFSACASCHADPHQGKFKPATCESCHTIQGWHTVIGFSQGKHPGLSLAGGHAGVACAKCHDRGNDRPPSKGSECAGCHRPVHAAPLGNRCIGCHASIRWTGLPREIGLETHRRTSYPLHGAHADAPCAGCHDPKRPAPQRYRGVASGTCTACHRDPHPGQLAARLGDCAPCHDDARFAPSRVAPAVHAQLGFPLDGKHEAAPCATCHPTAAPRLDFRVAARACADCHANVHGTQFAVEMAQGGCAQCHTTIGWKIAKVDHSIWPLTGAHGAVECAACHAAGYKGTARACDACHVDAHAAQFRLSEPVRACDFCHDTTRFAAFAAARHAALAGYVLEGKHAALECAACHPQETLHSGATAVRWRLGYRQCRACHADPHGGPR
jgi:hypothetical protein